jgi:hypothetical protein
MINNWEWTTKCLICTWKLENLWNCRSVLNKWAYKILKRVIWITKVIPWQLMLNSMNLLNNPPEANRLCCTSQEAKTNGTSSQYSHSCVDIYMEMTYMCSDANTVECREDAGSWLCRRGVSWCSTNGGTSGWSEVLFIYIEGYRRIRRGKKIVDNLWLIKRQWGALGKSMNTGLLVVSVSVLTHAISA